MIEARAPGSYQSRRVTVVQSPWPDFETAASLLDLRNHMI